MSVLRTDGNAPADITESSTWPRVAILYEDFATGARATSAIELPCGNPELETDFSMDMWRFDLLRDPETSNHVCERTVAADIVVLSTHGKGDLPGEVLLLLNRWLKARRDGPAALVVSFDESAREDLSARDRLAALQSACQAAGVDMFGHFGAGATRREGGLTVEDLNQRYAARTELLDQMLNRTQAYRDWGINE
jgi:hypothetical protein